MNFVLLLLIFFVEPMQEFFQGEMFLLPCITFSILGLVLLILTIRSKIERKQKRALLVTSISALGFFVGVFLHNAFYALAMVSESIPVLPALFEFFEIIFFLAAIFLSPILFITGIIMTIVQLIRSK